MPLLWTIRPCSGWNHMLTNMHSAFSFTILDRNTEVHKDKEKDKGIKTEKKDKRIRIKIERKRTVIKIERKRRKKDIDREKVIKIKIER